MQTNERANLIVNIKRLAPNIFSEQELRSAPDGTLQRVHAALTGAAIVQNCGQPSPVVQNYGEEDWLPTPSVIGDPAMPQPVFRPAYQRNGNLTNNEEDYLPITPIIGGKE